VCRCFRPRPPWLEGAYTTALGMFLLYPILLKITGVVLDWALLRIDSGKVVAGKG